MWCFSEVYNWLSLWICSFHVAWHRLTSLTLRILLLEKVSFNPNKGKLSIMNLKITGTRSRTADFCKSKMQDPFFRACSRSGRGNLFHFKTKWQPKNSVFMYPFACFQCSDASIRPLKTSKQIEINLKRSIKECNILIKPHWLSDTGNISLEIYKSDKQTRAAHSFVYRICNSFGKYFLCLKVNVH